MGAQVAFLGCEVNLLSDSGAESLGVLDGLAVVVVADLDVAAEGRVDAARVVPHPDLECQSWTARISRSGIVAPIFGFEPGRHL